MQTHHETHNMQAYNTQAHKQTNKTNQKQQINNKLQLSKQHNK